jgi:GWxTD domain-containing protein
MVSGTGDASRSTPQPLLMEQESPDAEQLDMPSGQQHELLPTAPRTNGSVSPTSRTRRTKGASRLITGSENTLGRRGCPGNSRPLIKAGLRCGSTGMKPGLRSASVQAIFLLLLVASAPSQPTPKPASKKQPSESARIKDLPDDERQWLTEFVAVIILEEEKKTFLDLAASYQREVFKEDFWQRREQPGLPIPLGPGYRYRYQELWELANSKYDGWRADAGRMVLRWGEPAAILTPRCGGSDVLRDVEVWTYNNVGPNGRSTLRYIFYRSYSTGPRKLWSLLDSEEHAFYPNSCGRHNFQSLRADCSASPNPRDPCIPCDDRCEVYKAYLEILARQNNGAGGAIEMATVFQPPVVSTEGLERLRNRWATTSNPGAKEIGVEGPSSGPPRDASSASTPAPTPEPRHRLSGDEIRERLLRLERKYKQFLDLAGPLLTEEDLSDFLQLTPGEKDKFIRAFWKRHS